MLLAKTLVVTAHYGLANNVFEVSKMSNDADLDRYISLRKVGRRHWDWSVMVLGKGSRKCEELAPTEAVAREEAREAARRLLDGDDD